MDWAAGARADTDDRHTAGSDVRDRDLSGRGSGGDWANGALKLRSPSHWNSDRLVGVPGLLPESALADIGSLPDMLSDVLRRLDTTTTSAQICGSMAKRLGEASPGLRAALVEVAAEADRSGCANAYHDPSHSRDVGVIFANLQRMQIALHPSAYPFDPDLFLSGCCAAFGHDIGHDGKEGGSPFRLEVIASDIVSAIMTRHQVAAHLIERTRCAILTTDVHRGYRALDDAQHGMFLRASDEPVSLNALEDFETRNMACLLRDSDVMQSAGLTPQDHDRQTARLERERGMPSHAMGVRGADFFLRDLIRGRFLSEAGRTFQPRLDRLLRLNALRARAGRVADGLAAFDRA